MKEFEGILQHNETIRNLDAIVGFLRASGYFTLRPFLNNIDKVRILIGIDVDKYIAKAASTGTIFQGAEDDVKADYLSLLRADIESANYSREVEEGILTMVKDIKDGKLELRAHLSKKIHAKVYILYPNEYNQYKMATAITGSSNLSGNGLGISQDKQYEFNVKLNDYDDVKFAMDEFEELWKEAEGCPIEAVDVDSTVLDTYLKGDVTPYELYIKMLMVYFADRVENEDSLESLSMPEGYTKFDYQADAVTEGYQKMLKYDGFFLADVVGLGKTVIATMIAKKFLLENGMENTKILVVYPPAVEMNWKKTFRDFGIDKYTNFVSNGSLSKVLDPDNYDYWNAEDFDLVLVDEAHKFRTHTTNAFEELQAICKMPRLETGHIGGYKKKVMLISATPMNNTPQDIYNEILLFQDPRRCTIDGISNLTNFFSPLIVEFKRLKARQEPDLAEFKRLAEKVRDRIIKPLTVRRTRHDIEEIERYARDVDCFPKVERPIKKEYELNERLANLFEKAIENLVNNLTYARYQAIAYLNPELSNGLYDNAETISRSLAGIRKNGLVKRLESSFEAFKRSLIRFRDANKNMIQMFEKDKVFIAPDLDINKLYELGLDDNAIEEKLNKKAENNPKNCIFKASDFDPKFIEMLNKDQAILDAMCADWDTVIEKDDSKFCAFEDLINHEIFKKSKNPGQKLVIFSEALDTVNYLARRLNRKDILVISAENRKSAFKTICENFDANYPTKKNDFNIIITTDVLAEGVNLHRSNIIINYDTPWNSTRLMQRIGRVNRIGSTSKHIYNYVFYPSREGNKEINLHSISLSKIQTFQTTYGEDNQIYSTEEILDPTLDRLFDEGIQAENSDRNLELPFFEELRNLYVNNRKEYNRIAKISLRSRTGRNSKTHDGVKLSNDTLVFLQTNFRKVFYRASDVSVEELSNIDAMNYLKADITEPKVERIANHHEHVAKAIEMFNKNIITEIEQAEFSPTNSGNLGAQVTTASSLLSTIISTIEDDDLRLKTAHLKALVEQGVITSIAMKLQRMYRLLTLKKLNRDQAISEIINMAIKYDPYYQSDSTRKATPETTPEIIL
ncbi:MAG: NgoFVII family restriction endonuclease, partial [Bacteroidales bacterium]|nr:NgoFVII family restriction endonuclease [Bacteroidales bacterium]